MVSWWSNSFMNRYYCLNCENEWYDLDHNGCPECGCREVIGDWDASSPQLNWDEDGHFEGDFPRNIHANDIELE
jgi:hypothetical protein